MRKLLATVMVMLMASGFAGVAFADGAITGYSFGNYLGWQNFGCSQCDGQVTDSALTGYAWSDNYGWINLNPADGGVLNDGQGNLSGQAWGEGTGWINFSGVVINSSGLFTGTATVDNGGVINFSCTNCDVQTTWRPASEEGSGGGGGHGSGGSHGGGGGGGGSGTGSGSGTTNPTNPTNPVTPTNPVNPVTPVNPITPVNPVTPANPVAPANPAGPANPTGPASPAAPANPGGAAPSAPANPVHSIIPVLQATSTVIQQVSGTAATQVVNLVKAPAGAAATKVLSTVGVTVTVATGATGAFASAGSFPELFLIPFRLLSLLMFALGLKKRNRPWGVAYDSVTKQPLDPVYVTLKDSQNNNVSSSITDIDGRYGFLIKPGIYTMQAGKTNYVFPSKKLAGQTSDEFYDDLYFGGNVEIKKEGDVIAKNIPMDSLKFDWNEFAKKDKTFMKFYSRFDFALRKISDTFFVIGFFIAILAYIIAPYPYNTIILSLYLIILLLRILGLKPKRLGYVISKASGIPLSFAILRIMIPVSDIEVSHKVTDKYGRYYCLIPRGRYYVKIESKNADGSYSLAYTSKVIDASRNGIIKERFEF